MSAQQAARTRPLTVLQSLPAVRSTTNPYLVQLIDALPASVEVRHFSWRTALLGRYDVLHVHWPENLVRGGGTVRTAARRVMFAGLMLRATVTRTRVVRTLHNTAPHEAGPLLERLLLGWCDRVTDRWIRLTPRTTPPTTAPVDTVLHGDYTAWYAGHDVPSPVPGRLLFFGLVRPYKGVEELLDAVHASGDPVISLRVVGKPSSDDLARRIEAAAASDDRIGAVLDYVDEARLAHEIGEAELVVLPYRAMHNSGSLLLALSLDRPVLVPDNDVTRDLAQEVGPGWVHRFSGDVDADSLRAGLAAARRRPPRARPDLSARTWSAIGDQHAATYVAATQERRGHR